MSQDIKPTHQNRLTFSQHEEDGRSHYSERQYPTPGGMAGFMKGEGSRCGQRRAPRELLGVGEGHRQVWLGAGGTCRQGGGVRRLEMGGRETLPCAPLFHSTVWESQSK